MDFKATRRQSLPLPQAVDTSFSAASRYSGGSSIEEGGIFLVFSSTRSLFLQLRLLACCAARAFRAMSSKPPERAVFFVSSSRLRPRVGFVPCN